MRGNWRKSKSMSLVNRGLRTDVDMVWLSATESYRVSKREQPMGGMRETTYDKIFEPEDAVDMFAQLCIEAIEGEYTAPQREADKVYDLRNAEDADA